MNNDDPNERIGTMSLIISLIVAALMIAQVLY
jgi:hypothetical protein